MNILLKVAKLEKKEYTQCWNGIKAVDFFHIK